MIRTTHVKILNQKTIENAVVYGFALLCLTVACWWVHGLWPYSGYVLGAVAGFAAATALIRNT